jgi:hypothetical protein
MQIRLAFGDFWSDFNKQDNIWIWILSQRHEVILDNTNPNLVISMGFDRIGENSLLIYHSNEPFFPDVKHLDNDKYVFLSNFFLDIPNHFRFPSYYMYIIEFIRTGVIKNFDFFNEKDRFIPEKTEFCSFVSKSLHGKRGRFYQKLNEYKPVHTNIYNHFSIPYDNNQFNSSIPKINFIKKYKFNIAFENNWRGNYPCWEGANVINGELQDMGGLISEKLIEPLISGTIPIYWGNEIVSKEFNSNTFLNYHDFKTENDLIDKIIELDNNEELYNSYFKEKISNENNFLTLDYVLDIFDKIVEKIPKQ